MRGLLAESGIVIPQGSATLRRALAELQDNGPTPILREILVEMSERLRLFEERLKGYDSRITGLARDDGVWGATEPKVRLAIAVSGVSERPELAPGDRFGHGERVPPQQVDVLVAERR